MGTWCNARLVVSGRSSDVRRFTYLAGVPVARFDLQKPDMGLRPLVIARASRIFRGDMLVGEGGSLFSERATSLGNGRLEKKYCFQAKCGAAPSTALHASDDGHDHFLNLSVALPVLRFVYVYGWDGWDENSYGSYLISRGHTRGYQVPIRLVEQVMTKNGVDDNPNDEWPYEPEIDAEAELMDLAQAHWKRWLLR
jgi:hypothetical protein